MAKKRILVMTGGGDCPGLNAVIRAIVRRTESEPDWEVIGFYPMNKRRSGQDNWYMLDYAARKKLMGGHARVGRQYAGKVKQLITGSTGLDDAEWGVTLFAHDTFQIKAIVYQMRFDEVSAAYADFGEFYIGIQLPLDELFRRLQL